MMFIQASFPVYQQTSVETCMLSTWLVQNTGIRKIPQELIRGGHDVEIKGLGTTLKLQKAVFETFVSKTKSSVIFTDSISIL